MAAVMRGLSRTVVVVDVVVVVAVGAFLEVREGVSRGLDLREEEEMSERAEEAVRLEDVNGVALLWLEMLGLSDRILLELVVAAVETG